MNLFTTITVVSGRMENTKLGVLFKTVILQEQPVKTAVRQTIKPMN